MKLKTEKYNITLLCFLVIIDAKRTNQKSSADSKSYDSIPTKPKIMKITSIATNKVYTTGVRLSFLNAGKDIKQVFFCAKNVIPLLKEEIPVAQITNN